MTISAHQLKKSFGTPPTDVLKGIDLEISDGEFVAVTGRSGSGKSTLLYAISTLDKPSAGAVCFDGKNLNDFTDKELHAFRNTQIGFVFQFHYLLPELSLLENVLVPAIKAKRVDEIKPYAMQLLEMFGLSHRAQYLPSKISGGESQRAALARALVMKPRYVFADEPTGSLDSVNGDQVMKILSDLNREQKTAIIMVTHDPDYAAMATRQIHLIDGKLA